MEKYSISKVAVVGAGVMGAGIAQVFAHQGFSVIVNDLNDDVLQKAEKDRRQSAAFTAKWNIVRGKS
ncbi:hypothetical protein ES703_79804 [subsurface metagenome]